MTGAFTRSALHPFRAVLLAVCLVPGAGTLLLGTAGPAGATGTASVTISPAASGGQYQTGQTVSVTVGPNSLFAPNTRVVILECADPGGSVADLPTGFIDCDGNTIQGDTVMVQANGSFAESSYTIYALPNRALGESSTNIPVCSATQPCVLFVGEDQNDFTQPKVFSKPFTVSGAGLTTPAGSSGSSGQSSAAGGSSAGPAAGGTSDAGSTSGSGAGTSPGVADAAVSLPAGSLAFTGMPDWILPLAALGGLLVLVGSGGAALARRERA